MKVYIDADGNEAAGYDIVVKIPSEWVAKFSKSQEKSLLYEYLYHNWGSWTKEGEILYRYREEYVKTWTEATERIKYHEQRIKSLNEDVHKEKSYSLVIDLS